MKLETKYGVVKIYAKTIEDEALKQIEEFANSPIGENANIRILPDAHHGAGCVIGTTMIITDKVCPNIVGVDIGCGVDLVKTNVSFEDNLEKLDKVIREHIPSGKNNHLEKAPYINVYDLRCWRNGLAKRTIEGSQYALGTLGGGNHFIEAYENGYISVHSGSRNIGYKVAEFYQNLAIKQHKNKMRTMIQSELENIEPREREAWLKQQKDKYLIKDDLAYLSGQDKDDYLHDMNIMNIFAIENRKTILKTIVEKLGGEIFSHISSTHNFIDVSSSILRKGATSAKKDEMVIIPLNMRDGVLLCRGKGNPDWNHSAPHGAGRLFSRTKAKQKLSMNEYIETMSGIYSTCISEKTLDESPFAYKDMSEIIEQIEPTVEILERLIPIYNFKASE